MNRSILTCLGLVAVFLVAAAPAYADDDDGVTSIGGGVHYNKYLDDIESDDVEEEAFSYVVALRRNVNWLIGMELAGELQPEDLTGREEDTIIPQAYLFLGKVIYGGAGIGIGYYDGDFADDPNYYLRAGLDLEFIPGIFLDVSARYVVQDIEEVEDEVDDNVDTDTVTLGANLRFRI
jgi:hypothetical protein